MGRLSKAELPVGDPTMSPMEALMLWQVSPPKNRRALWHYVWRVFGIKIPTACVCQEAGHVSPFDAFSEAYFAETPVVVWQASRGNGKCAKSSDYLHCADGVVRTFEECLKENKPISVYIPTEKGISVTDALFEDNGIRECKRIKLESGEAISRTLEHPIMAARVVKENRQVKVSAPSWVQAKDLTVDHVVQVANGFPDQPEYPISDAAISMLGLLLGDGSTGHEQIVSLAGYPGSATLLQFEKDVAELGGVITYNRRAEGSTAAVLRYGIGKGSRERKNHPLYKLLESFEILGCKAEGKKFPSWVWKLSHRQLALLVNRLWATDGYLTCREHTTSTAKGKIHKVAEFEVVSQQLCKDMARAMHVLGVPGYVTDTGKGYYKKNGVKVLCQNRYSYRPMAAFMERMFDVIGPILGKESTCNDFTDYITNRPFIGQKWRFSAPDGYHYQQITEITEEVVPTVSIHVPEGNVFLSPVVEHNTFLLALLALTEMVTLNCFAGILGGSGEQSRRVHDYTAGKDPTAMGKFWDCPGAPTWLLTDSPTKSGTRLITGGKMMAMMASQASVRGLHPPRLRMDEIDVMDLDIFKAAMGQPQRAGHVKAQTVLSSTHQNPKGTFSWVLKQAKEKSWPIRQWCWREVLWPHGWMTQEDIEDKKATMDKESWLREMEHSEPKVRGLILDPLVANKQFPLLKNMPYEQGKRLWYNDTNEPIEDVENEKYFFEDYIPGETYYSGIDFAKMMDWTVITTFRKSKDPEKPDLCVAYQRLGRVSWEFMCMRVDEQIEKYGNGGACYDATGQGGVAADFLRVGGQPWDFNQRRLTMMMLSKWVEAIEQGKVLIPRIKTLYDEHKGASYAEVYGREHLPDSFASCALAWKARDYSREILLGRAW